MAEDIPDRGSGRYENGKPITATSREQKVLNESWPLRDTQGLHARGIDDQPADNQRLVWVRIEFETDGEVELPGRATRWNRSHVYVITDDPRVPRGQVWVRARDVRRRDVQG